MMIRCIWVFCLIGPAALIAAFHVGCREQTVAAKVDPKPSSTLQGDKPVHTEKATFAAGCFWGVELDFSQIPGVVKTTVGYTGGATKGPTYHDVCTDRTGHAEAVLIEYDPAKVAYEKLVDAFFELHDPTQVNRQGPDVGTQYRTAIFYYSPEQKAVAEAVKDRVAKSGKFKTPIATQIVPAVEFWPAEDYHQQYFAKRGITRSCHARS
jgi:peptide-methionine (S)-S-oxide reductase